MSAKNNISISVIIPVYNGENYIKKTLESIIVQKLITPEIIVINDGSTDSTIDIIEEFWEKYKPNGCIINTSNNGASHARNIGVNIANGDYVLFLDADDYIEPKLFERMAKNNYVDYDVFYYGYNEVNENYEMKSSYNEYFSIITDISGVSAVINKLSKKIWICHGNAIYNREILKVNNIKYLTGIHHGEDLYFICKALYCSKKIGAMDFNGVNIMCRNDSVMHSPYSEKFKDAVFASKKLYEDIVNNTGVNGNTLLEKVLCREIMEQVSYVSKKMITSSKYSYKKLISEIDILVENNFERLYDIKDILTTKKYYEYLFISKNILAYILIVKVYKFISGKIRCFL